MKIIITTPGNLSKKDIAILIEKGIAVVIAKNPKQVRIISDSDFLDTNTLAMSALEAIAIKDNGYVNTEFIKNLSTRMKAKESLPKPPIKQ